MSLEESWKEVDKHVESMTTLLDNVKSLSASRLWNPTFVNASLLDDWAYSLVKTLEEVADKEDTER